MNTWIEQVYDTIQQNQLLHAGDSVLVALSGGADSVALLSAMCTLKDRLHLADVQAAHLHHGLRGASADRDEAFVRSLCQSLSVPLTVSHVDVCAEARLHKETIEEAGRRLRYAFFDSIADTMPTPVKIAVAHNANDQAETIIFHMARGSGLKGIRGIPIQRHRIIRPLLHCSSASIREYCGQHQLSYMLDETNDNVAYTRNRIRHHILPELNCINPAVVPSLCRLAEIATQEDAFLDELAQALIDKASISYGYNALVLRDAHPVVCKRALMIIAQNECQTSLDYAQTEALFSLVHNGGSFGGLPHRIIALCNQNVLSFTLPSAKPASNERAHVSIGNVISFQDKTIYSKLISYDQFLEISKIHKNFLHYCISYDMITDGVSIRPRHIGDCMQLHLSGGHKTLKKLFNEWSIPTSIRSKIPIVCDGERIAAVLGYGVDQTYAVNDHTRQILFFDCYE